VPEAKLRATRLTKFGELVFVLPIRRYNPPFLEANTITFLTPETGSSLTRRGKLDDRRRTDRLLGAPAR
jgi:hypothetical protein